MKTINSFRSKLLALTLALMASVSTFAYDFGFVNDFHIDGFAYKIIDRTEPCAVALIEVADCEKHVAIPESVIYNDTTFIVTTMGMGNIVFSGIAQKTMESLYIPKTIMIINYRALGACPNLMSIVVDKENKYLDSRNNCNAVISSNDTYRPANQLVAGCKTTVIPNSVTEIGNYAFVRCETLENIIIPEGVTTIRDGAFYECTSLSSIKLPESLTQLTQQWIFGGCTSLKEVFFFAKTPPYIAYGMFNGITPTIYVPKESLDAYKKALYWKNFDIQAIPYKSQWCDTWNMLVRTGSIYPPSSTPYRYQLAKDTVIGEHTYTAVVQKEINDALDAPRYVAAVRFTDDRKVYIYYDNAEYLLYDFNVQEGDELEVFAGINNYTSEIKTYKCAVTGVEQYACVGCPATITLEVHNHPDDFREFYRQTQWIEGVGDINGFLNGINHYVEMDGGGSEYLLCAYKGDELKYTGDLYEEYGCGDNAEQNPEDLFPTLWGLQRTGCTKTIGENENGTVWGSRSYLMQEIETATIDGKQYLLFGINDIYSYDDYCSLWLREENNKILVYSTAQKKDLVLYDFTLNVGDSLPRLYVDYELSSVVDYYKYMEGYASTAPFVVTEVSTITLLDGKEYKKWTFDNGRQYVEGIGSFGACYAHNDFYQLIADAPLYSDVYSQYLVCVSKNGQLLYKMDDAEMEQLETECLCEIEPKWSETWCNQWNILSHGYLGPQDPLAGARTSIYWLSNNTVNRNGQEYIPLMCSSSMPNEESTHLVGELRFTEDKQVYFYYAFDETEYLLYDFGAELGDTLELFAGLEFYNYHKTYTHVITDKETLDDGRLQIQADVVIRIDNGAGEYFEEKHPITWIEGLGSTYGIIFNPSNPGVAGDGAIIMLCAYRDDECVYTTNFSDYKNMGCVYNNDGAVDEDLFPMLTGLQRTICNEFCGDTEDDNSSNTTYKQTFDKIVFERDQPYIYCNSAFLLREENNKILIYSHSLDKDLVLYDFTLEVGDSLPQLYLDEEAKKDIYWIYYEYMNVVDYNKYNDSIYPADALIVTDVSMITLLDGKEYKKWTFNNGMEYVEGIGMYGGRRGGNFFGLIQEVVVPCHTGTHLVCASKNGQLLYQMDDTEMERLGAECLCDYNSGPKKDNAKEGKIGGRPTPTQWNMLEVETKEMDGTPTILRAETFSYTLENDSIVTKGKTFYQLARQSTKDTAITKSFVGALHFGEDEDNRVYFLRDGVEYVLYDFTAEPGDTLEIFAGINNYPQETTYTHVVTGKDTLENGACRMMLEVVFPEETASIENAQKVWLAGLGSIDGIVHNAATRATKARSSETQTSVMLCAWREDSCLYTTNHPEYDTFGCVYNQDPTAVEDVETSGYKYQKIIRDGHLYILRDNKLYDVLGTPMN